MALIKCPECGKEISDKAHTCVHCGYPLIEVIASGDVRIKMPNNIVDGVVGFFSSKRAAVKDQCGQILWEGNHGENMLLYRMWVFICGPFSTLRKLMKLTQSDADSAANMQCTLFVNMIAYSPRKVHLPLAITDAM